MKKFLIVLILSIIGFISIDAQTQWYRANTYAYKYINNYGHWTNWSDWISCSVNIKFDIDNDIIVIYSNKTQIYAIFDGGQQYTDSDGGSQIRFDVIDQDYDKGTVRLRIERNGNSQIYIDFANVSWVYNVRRIS